MAYKINLSMGFFRIFILFFLSNALSAQVYTFDDIFKTNKVYDFGYDFTRAKVIESSDFGDDQAFIFGIIQFMNKTRDEKEYAKFFKKDTVISAQKIVNKLNSEIPKNKIKGAGWEMLDISIPKDSLQEIINAYDTKSMAGIGFVQIIESLYKPKKQTKVWFVFFDISSKKILDTFENTNKDADSWHGYSEYWSVGLRSAMGFFLSDHYHKARKDFKKKIK